MLQYVSLGLGLLGGSSAQKAANMRADAMRKNAEILRRTGRYNAKVIRANGIGQESLLQFKADLTRASKNYYLESDKIKRKVKTRTFKEEIAKVRNLTTNENVIDALEKKADDEFLAMALESGQKQAQFDTQATEYARQIQDVRFMTEHKATMAVVDANNRAYNEMNNANAVAQQGQADMIGAFSNAVANYASMTG
jgi:DNA polymerase II large subunit